jgi:spore coat polysaccharide biosynthesis protein SpsF
MSAPRVVAILQARLSSSRLPGKVLMPLHGQPMLSFMIARLKRAKRLDQIIVATSDDPSDDALVEAMTDGDVRVFRGPLEDVLARFALAANAASADVIVRVTGDCPLIDADVVDRVATLVASGACDYASNTDPPTYPDGLDCEAFSRTALERAAEKARLSSEREHVTPFISNDPQLRKVNVRSVTDMSSLRWTVDYDDDLSHVRQLVDAVEGDPILADRFDFLRAMETLGRTVSVAKHLRNEGYEQSLAEDGLEK